MDIHKVYPRRFLGTDDDLGDEATVRKAYAALADLPVTTKEEVAAWCDAWAEIQSATQQVKAKLYYEITRDTRNKEVEAAYNRLVKDVLPVINELDDGAKKTFLSFREDWVPPELNIARQKARWDVDLYRETNLPLISKNFEYENDYQKISSEWSMEFDGKMMTRKQISVFLESPDRELRERAWHAVMDLHLRDYGKLDDLFDRCLETRNTMASNADLDDYVEYQYRNWNRLSYDRHDTARFRDAIREHVVPAVGKIFERRRSKLGLDEIRPWDTNADPDGAQPPKIYEDIDDLKAKVEKVLGAIHPPFADGFRLMDEKGYLDLENRSGKAPGAYMESFAEERISMIFSNFVGTSRDFDTLIHEGGHAMHGFLCRHLPKPAREVPLEFCEVASMALELLARPHWGIVYDEEQRHRIGIKQLERTLTFLPFMAMLDEFQAWVYSHPEGVDRQNRAEYWRSLSRKYQPHIDYQGLEKEQGIGWQYLHVYAVPLYYVEYGVAQVGAQQVYLRSQEDYDAAVRDYIHALSLGNTIGLPELYEAAGIKFVMKHPDIMAGLTDRILREIGL